MRLDRRHVRGSRHPGWWFPVVAVGILASTATARAEPVEAPPAYAGLTLRAGIDRAGGLYAAGLAGGGRVLGEHLWVHGRLEAGGWIVIGGDGGSLSEAAVGPGLHWCWRDAHVCTGAGIEGGVVRRVRDTSDSGAAADPRWYPLLGVHGYLDLAASRSFAFRLGARAFHQWALVEPPGPRTGAALTVQLLYRW